MQTKSIFSARYSLLISLAVLIVVSLFSAGLYVGTHNIRNRARAASLVATPPDVCQQIYMLSTGETLWVCPPVTPVTLTPTVFVTNAPTATDTPIPSATSSATNTLAPSATATITPTLPTATAAAPTATLGPASTPFASAPLCPSHDPTVWHALWDAARGCHYDHTHNMNPNDPAVVAVFGPPAALWGGQTISYPWATSAMENTMKHGGYKWMYRLNVPCGGQTYDTGNPVNCITDTRIEYHIVGGAMDAMARYHSAYPEYRVCKQPAYTQCGFVRGGSPHVDFGILEVPYKGAHVVRPGGTIDFGQGSTYGALGMPLVMTFPPDAAEMVNQNVNEEPYVSQPNFGEPGSFAGVWSGPNSGFGNYNYGHDYYARFVVRVFDSWDATDPANPNALHFFCRDGSCDKNASLHALNEFTVWISPTFDPDGDGFADFNGYTDRYGRLAPGCTAIGLDCVPYVLQHAPVGYAHHEDAGGGDCCMVEFDTSPPGVRWVRFPN